MKKFFATILAILYLSLSAGATIHVHFCMDEFVNISLSDTKNAVCEKCGMQSHSKTNDCCKDIKIVKKTADTHQSNHADHTINTVAKAILPQNYWVGKELITAIVSISATYRQNNPPNYPSTPLYIRHRNFRI